MSTVFENPTKSRIQHCERNELRLHFEWTKVTKNAKNGQFWRVIENLKLLLKQCYQTSNFKYDKNWWKKPKMKKFKCDILGDFKTL